MANKNKKTTQNAPQNETFDQIINLVSEIVVIKARLQQLMEKLIGESRDSRTACVDLQQLGETIGACDKGVQALSNDENDTHVKNAKKALAALHIQFDHVFSKIAASGLQSLVLDLDEVTGRFGKVLGELQNVLMKMRTGSSSIAIIQVLLVKHGKTVFAFPIEDVLEIVKIKKDEIYSVDSNETIQLREHALGLIQLEKTIGIEASESSSSDEKRVVVIKNENEQLGVVVDSLLGEEDIVVKELTPHFRNVKGVSGASILGDGQVALILNTEELLQEAKVRS